MDTETKLKNVFDMDPTMSREKTVENLWVYRSIEGCEIEKGFDKCLEFMKNEAYLHTALMNMYNVNPISTGLTQIRYNKTDMSLLIDVALLIWTNGVIVVYKSDDIPDYDYTLIRLPKMKKYALPKVDALDEQKG